jgi:site-specific DNA recombinase
MVALVLASVRLSRLVDESTSPERQRDQIHTWTKLHGNQVVHITEDTDVSGAVPASSRRVLVRG